MISRVEHLVAFLTIPLLTSTLDQHQIHCGVRRNQHESLIVHGSGTRPGEWPWHAAMLHKTGRFLDYACGGTLISEEFVVTAAHCLHDQDTGHRLTKRRVRVRLGVHNLDKTNGDAVREFAVSALHFSDNYSRETNRGDIGLVELTEPVQFTDFILPACINGYGPVHAELGTVIGWGATEHEAISPVLRKATLPVVDSVDCLESDRGFFGSMIHRDMFCAGYSNGTVVCNGDSGGGLFVERNGFYLLAGIISFTKGREDGSGACVSQGFAGFTNVAQYSGWIQNVTGVTVPVLEEVVEPEGDPRDLRLSERYCAIYQRLKGSATNPWVTVKIFHRKRQLCLATVISDRYLLSTGSCLIDENGTILKPLSATITTKRYKVTIPEVVPIIRSEDPNILLIDLKKKYDELKPDITCLWTEPHLISENPAPNQTISGRKLVLNDNRHCPRETLGNGLVRPRKGDDKSLRLVGPLIRCNPVTYARLMSLDLDWIESVVWSEVDVVVPVEVTTESTAQKVGEYAKVIGTGIGLLAFLGAVANIAGDDGFSSNNVISNTISNSANNNVRIKISRD